MTLETIRADQVNYNLPVFKVEGKDGYSSIRLQQVKLNNKHFYNISYGSNSLQFLRKLSYEEIIKHYPDTSAYVLERLAGNEITHYDEFRLCTLYIPPGTYETVEDVVSMINKIANQTIESVVSSKLYVFQDAYDQISTPSESLLKKAAEGDTDSKVELRKYAYEAVLYEKDDASYTRTIKYYYPIVRNNVFITSYITTITYPSNATEFENAISIDSNDDTTITKTASKTYFEVKHLSLSDISKLYSLILTRYHSPSGDEPINTKYETLKDLISALSSLNISVPSHSTYNENLNPVITTHALIASSSSSTEQTQAQTHADGDNETIIAFSDYFTPEQAKSLSFLTMHNFIYTKLILIANMTNVNLHDPFYTEMYTRTINNVQIVTLEKKNNSYSLNFPVDIFPVFIPTQKIENEIVTKPLGLDMNVYTTELTKVLMIQDNYVEIFDGMTLLNQYATEIAKVPSFYRTFQKKSCLWDIFNIDYTVISKDNIMYYDSLSDYIFTIAGTFITETVCTDISGGHKYDYAKTFYSRGDVFKLELPNEVYISVSTHHNVDAIIHAQSPENMPITSYDINLVTNSSVEQKYIIPINKSYTLRKNAVLYVYITADTGKYNVPIQYAELKVEHII